MHQTTRTRYISWYLKGQTAGFSLKRRETFQGCGRKVQARHRVLQLLPRWRAIRMPVVRACNGLCRRQCHLHSTLVCLAKLASNIYLCLDVVR